MMASRKYSWVTAAADRDEEGNKTPGAGKKFEQGAGDGDARDANRAEGKCREVDDEGADPRFAGGGQTWTVEDRCAWPRKLRIGKKAPRRIKRH